MATGKDDEKKGKSGKKGQEYHPIFELDLDEFELDSSFLMQNLLEEETATGEPEITRNKKDKSSMPEKQEQDVLIRVLPHPAPESPPVSEPHPKSDPTSEKLPPEDEEGHRERLKKRFLQEGLEHFPDHTILELLLFFGIQRKDTNALAHRLMEQFGSFSQTLQADYEQLLELEGMTPNAAILLKMMPQVSRRYIEQLSPPVDMLNTSDQIGKFLIPKFLGRSEEAVFLLCLDNACRLLRCELLSEGGLSQATFQVRRIVEIAFQCKAINVILAHNHPHGVVRPSSQDIRITETLYSVLKPVGIELLDHFVVAGEEYVSLMELGYLGVRAESERNPML